MPANVTSTSSRGFRVEFPASGRDAEKADGPKLASESFDMEHVHGDDDPMKWSILRKVSRFLYRLILFPAQSPATGFYFYLFSRRAYWASYSAQ